MAPGTIPEVYINKNSCLEICHDNHPNWHQKCKWPKVRAPHADEMPVNNFLLGSIRNFLPLTKLFTISQGRFPDFRRFSFRFLYTHDREIIPGIFPKYSITKPVYWSTTLNWLRSVFIFSLSLAKTIGQSEGDLKTIKFLFYSGPYSAKCWYLQIRCRFLLPTSSFSRYWLGL